MYFAKSKTIWEDTSYICNHIHYIKGHLVLILPSITWAFNESELNQPVELPNVQL